MQSTLHVTVIFTQSNLQKFSPISIKKLVLCEYSKFWIKLNSELLCDLIQNHSLLFKIFECLFKHNI